MKKIRCLADNFKPHLIKFFTVLLVFLAIYGCIYAFDADNSLPGNCTNRNTSRLTYTVIECKGGNLFALLILYICAKCGGILISYINLPPLLGMLISGFLLRNVPIINVAVFLQKMISGYLRNAALMVILIRAGLGLDPNVLRKLSFVVVRLAFIPCLLEATTVGVLGHFILGLPWGFSFILGFVLSAVSPAVVVPSVLELERKGLGVDQGVNTLIIAAASIDDVLAISGFGVSMGLAFSISDSFALRILRGPLEAAAGIAFGCTLGALLWLLPSSNMSLFLFYRTILLYLLSAVAMFGSMAWKIPGAGALGVLVLAFMASFGWRKDPLWNGKRNTVTQVTDRLWWLLQPFLFGLIGSGLDVLVIDLKSVGFGVLVFVCGLVARLIVTFIVVFGANFSLNEQLFIAISWLPKATVQAAIGPVALDFAIANNFDYSTIIFGELILAIAAISIISTAPLGAVLIAKTAPFLLKMSVAPCNVVEVNTNEEHQMLQVVCEKENEM